MSERLPYRADIDGLRAVAVLLVVVFHFDLVAGGKAGFMGVDLFFVISGYLITAIVRRQLDAGTFSLGAFYAGRVRRLAPALCVVLLLSLLVGALTLLPQDLLELARQTLASQFYLANVYYWRNVSYFGLQAGDVFLLHMWSLAVEEQFYLLFPLLLIGLHRRLRRWFWPALGAVLLASFALNLGFVARKPEASFYLLPTRAWELLVGALLAGALPRWQAPRALRELLGVGGAALIAAAVLGYREGIAFPGLYALLPVAGAAALIVAGSGPALLPRLLAQPGLVYVGRISYALYLVHWPVHVYAGRWLGSAYGGALRAAMLALSLLLAAAIHHAVENPVRLRRRLSQTAPLLRGYAAALALSLAAFALAWQTGGLPQRFDPAVVALAAHADDRSPPLSECEFARAAQGPAWSPCRIGRADGAPRWLVYGDSHAWAAHAAFDRWLAAKGEAGYFVFRHSCPPLLGLDVFGDRGECRAFNDAVLGFLDAHAEVRTVVLVSTWRQAIEGLLSTGASARLPSREASLQAFDHQFSHTLAALHERGHRIYVWEPLPGAAAPVPQALAWAAAGRAVDEPTVPLQRYRATYGYFFAALEHERARVSLSFSPSEALCGEGRCAVEAGGKPLYFDNNHVTRSSADFWVRMMQGAERRAGLEHAAR